MATESSSAAAAGKKLRNYDIFFEIFLRLPARSIQRFRKVCKAFNALATDPYLPRTHIRQQCDDDDDNVVAAGPNSMLIHCDPHTASPSLTLCIVDADVGNNQILHTDIRIPAGKDVKLPLTLQLSCDGLLCFSSSERGPNRYYICNPIRKNCTWTTVAASLNPTAHLKGFYFHRSTGEYRLLQYFFYFSPLGQFEVGCEVAAVNGLGENKSWRLVYNVCYQTMFVGDSAGELDRLLATVGPWGAPITMYGNLHWLPDCRKDVGIIVFDTESEKFRLILIPSKIKECSLNLTLLKIGGNLCIGRLMSFPEEMELWMLKDYNNQRWTNMHTIISSKGIARTPSEEDADQVAGSLLKRCYWNISQFSLYDLKYKTCFHTHIQHVVCSRFFVDYTESMVTV